MFFKTILSSINVLVDMHENTGSLIKAGSRIKQQVNFACTQQTPFFCYEPLYWAPASSFDPAKMALSHKV